MIPIKTNQEIEIIKEAGSALAHVKEIVRKRISPGVTLFELDQFAECEIRKYKGMEPGFQHVHDYKWATCINVNEGLVHGIPGNYEVRPGDKISVDVGILYKGMNTDSAFTVGVVPVGPIVAHFIEVGRLILDKAIAQVKPGNRIGHISKVIDEELKKAGYSPNRVFTGHGVGRTLHEEPPIPCFFVERMEEDTPEILPGMVLAVEVIYSQGKPDVVIGSDGWTASLRDGTMGGLFEETIVVTNKAPLIVTR